MDPEPKGFDFELLDHDQHWVSRFLTSRKKVKEMAYANNVTQIAGSTSSVSPSRALSAPPPARPSTPAGPSSSGLSRSALAGRRSSGCRLLVSPSSSTSPSCSTASSSRPLSSCGLRRRSRSCCPRSLWSTSEQIDSSKGGHPIEGCFERGPPIGGCLIGEYLIWGGP